MADERSILIAVAEAVKEAINAATLSQAATAARTYLPRFATEELATLHVSVVPKGVELTRLDRTKWQEDYLVDVGVQKVIANDAEGDGLAKLTDEILDLFTTARLTDYRAGLVKVEPIPYWPDHLKEMSLFTSIQTLTFRVVR